MMFIKAESAEPRLIKELSILQENQLGKSLSVKAKFLKSC